MGWGRWDGASSESPPSPSWRRSGGWSPGEEKEERYSTRRVVQSNCRTEEVEPGRFIRKCDKREEVLRDCVGRPTEVVESNSEHTEEDVTDEVTRGHIPFGSSGGADDFSFPGLRNDIEAMERSMLGGLDSFLQAAEEMKNGFFHSFGMPSSRNRESSPPLFRQVPLEEGKRGKDASERGSVSAYDEFVGKVTDV